jgi:hypothetical protein
MPRQAPSLSDLLHQLALARTRLESARPDVRDRRAIIRREVQRNARRAWFPAGPNTSFFHKSPSVEPLQINEWQRSRIIQPPKAYARNLREILTKRTGQNLPELPNNTLEIKLNEFNKSIERMNREGIALGQSSTIPFNLQDKLRTRPRKILRNSEKVGLFGFGESSTRRSELTLRELSRRSVL